MRHTEPVITTEEQLEKLKYKYDILSRRFAELESEYNNRLYKIEARIKRDRKTGAECCRTHKENDNYTPDDHKPDKEFSVISESDDPRTCRSHLLEGLELGKAGVILHMTVSDGKKTDSHAMFLPECYLKNTCDKGKVLVVKRRNNHCE